jgi:lipoyl(octanoyl) transferase
MAVDRALALHRRPGEGVLRFYRWIRPTLSFGRHQKPAARYDPMALDALGVDAVRRPTGGREVLHDRELTYAVIAPAAGPGSLRALYAEVNRALVQGLSLLGVPAQMVAAGRTIPPPDAGACFADPAPGEVMVEGQKLVGSAQVRMGPTLLQHGSILLGPASVSLQALARGGQTVQIQEGACLERWLGGAVPLPSLVATLEAALAGAFGGVWVRASGLTDDEEATARALMAEDPEGEALWEVGPMKG